MRRHGCSKTKQAWSVPARRKITQLLNIYPCMTANTREHTSMVTSTITNYRASFHNQSIQHLLGSQNLDIYLPCTHITITAFEAAPVPTQNCSLNGSRCMTASVQVLQLALCTADELCLAIQRQLTRPPFLDSVLYMNHTGPQSCQCKIGLVNRLTW